MKVLKIIGYGFGVLFVLVGLAGSLSTLALGVGLLATMLLATNAWGLRAHFPHFNSPQALHRGAAYAGLIIATLLATAMLSPQTPQQRRAAAQAAAQARAQARAQATQTVLAARAWPTQTVVARAQATARALAQARAQAHVAATPTPHVVAAPAQRAARQKQGAAAGQSLAASDRAAFAALLPAVQQCDTGLTTVNADLRQATANLNAGQVDAGSLGPDARAMRNDCLAAAERVDGLRFAEGPDHAAARRVKAELHAALVDLAQGADDCIEVAIDITSGEVSAAPALLQDGNNAWTAAGAHMRVASGYLRL